MAEQDVKSSVSFGIVSAMRVLLNVIAIGFLVAPVYLWASDDGTVDSEASYLFALGQLHRNEGSYEEALDALKRAVAAEPGEPYLQLEFSEFLFQLGRLNDAAEHAEAARRAAPGSADVLKLLGRIYLRLGERSPAFLRRSQDAFETLRDLEPEDIDVREILGRLHLSRGEPGNAAVVLREAHALAPRDRMVTSLLVEALGALGERTSVLEELRALIEEDPSFLQPRLTLARALDQTGNAAAVIELLEATPENVRLNVDFLRELSSAYYRVGAMENALDTSGRWLALRPQDTMGRYLQSLALAGLGRDGEAEQMLVALLEENPDSQEFALSLAGVIELQGRRYEAAELLRQLAERLRSQQKNIESRRVTTMVFDLYARGGDWEQILRLSDTALGSNLAEDDPVRLLPSLALEEVGRPEEALAYLETLRGEEALVDRVAGQRASILFGLGREKEAETALAVLTGSDDLSALMLAAEVLHDAELFGQAIPVLKKAARITPDNLDVIFWLGASHERSGNLDAAEVEFERVLALDGDFAPALNYLGYMWAEQGQNLDRALELVGRAVALEPDNGAYLDSLGWAYFRIGEYAAAREHLERAAQLVGDDAVVFEHLGDLYVASGDRGQAESAYQKALELKGENRLEVQRKLSELKDR